MTAALLIIPWKMEDIAHNHLTLPHAFIRPTKLYAIYVTSYLFHYYQNYCVRCEHTLLHQVGLNESDEMHCDLPLFYIDFC